MLPLIICDLSHKSNIKQIDIQGNPFYDSNGLGFHLSDTGQNFSFLHTGGTWVPPVSSWPPQKEARVM